MKATGIVRKIDDLGRVVIPKEIRRTMKIREGEMLEIFTGRENEVVFKKYSPVGGVGESAAMFAEAAAKASGVNVAVCDRDTVTAAAGKDRRAVLGKNVSRTLNELMENRKCYTADGESASITDTGEGSISHFCPVVADGTVVGGVMSFRTDGFSAPEEAEKQVISTGAMFLSGQIEI